LPQPWAGELSNSELQLASRSAILQNELLVIRVQMAAGHETTKSEIKKATGIIASAVVVLAVA
jgi:ribosomal protein L29